MHTHPPTQTNHPLSEVDAAVTNKWQISFFASPTLACFGSRLTCPATSEDQESNHREQNFLKWNDCQLKFVLSSQKRARKIVQSFHFVLWQWTANMVKNIKGNYGKKKKKRHRIQMNYERDSVCLWSGRFVVTPVCVIMTISKCWNLIGMAKQ